jgi:hypothetical protein
VVSDGAALGKEELAARAFVGHKYDRARDRVYHCLLLLGSPSCHWKRRLNRFLLQSCSPKMRRDVSQEGNRASAMLLMGLSDSRMESHAMTPSNAEALIAFLLYCLAVHVTQQERPKRPAS